jgi:hypothetical protein
MVLEIPDFWLPIAINKMDWQALRLSLKAAHSLPKNTGRNGLYKTADHSWLQVS